MATGLLVLCLGQATRLVEYMTGHEKRYEGVIALGTTTTTDDGEGSVLEVRPVPSLDRERIEAWLARFRGAIEQRPPMFSAIHVAGRRSYELARAGKAVELPARSVVVRELSGHLTSRTTLAVDVRCSAGTYVRSFARDLGEAIGCGGHLAALRRLECGPFRSEDAITLAVLEGIAGEGELEQFLIPADEAIAEFDAAVVGDAGSRLLANGMPWEAESTAGNGVDSLRIYSTGGEFVGVGSLSRSGQIRARKVFWREKSPD
jgi:tRNA pseudouridine55 synthase